MDTNKINEIVKAKKKKITVACTAYFVLATGLAFFIRGVWFAIGEVGILIAFLFLVAKLYSFEYIINDLCDPELYYYAFIGITKREPPVEKKQEIAELIGDYEGAIEIASARLNKAKKDVVKFSIFVDMMRISFYAGDFEMAKKYIEKARMLSVSKYISESYSPFFDFYLSYISGEYSKAKEMITQINKPSKKATRRTKFKLMYLEAIVDYALGDTEVANKKFKAIIESCPMLDIANSSNRYLNNDTEVTLVDLSSHIENGKTLELKKQKVEWWKLISIVIIIAMLVFSGLSYNEADHKADTIEQSIKNYYYDVENDIDFGEMKYLMPDEKHTVVIQKTGDSCIYVSYIKHKGNKYECEASTFFDRADVNSNEIDEFMSVSGKSKKLKYSIRTDKNKIRSDYEIIEFDGVYFGYKFDDEKFHIGATSGIQITDDKGNILFET